MNNKKKKKGRWNTRLFYIIEQEGPYYVYFTIYLISRQDFTM
jgi:hypothetical protein